MKKKSNQEYKYILIIYNMFDFIKRSKYFEVGNNGLSPFQTITAYLGGSAFHGY